jgi:hypothetical protein
MLHGERDIFIYVNQMDINFHLRQRWDRSALT